MYRAFLEGINESFNDAILSAKVASFLTQAQVQLLNDILYNRKEKGALIDVPRTLGEADIYSAEHYARLEVRLNANTLVNGFWAKPANFLYIQAVRAGRPLDDCGDTFTYTSVPFTRKNELDSYYGNRFKRPVWEDTSLPPSYWYRPQYINLVQGGIDGIMLYPNRQYAVEIDYIRLPIDIQVQSPADEVADYGSLPGYVVVAADVNSELAENLHDEIVRRAIMLYGRSRRNLEDMQIDVTMIDTNKN